MIYAGVDPGKSGAIAIIDSENIAPDNITIYDIPLIGSEIDFKELNEILKTIVTKEHFLVLENVHAIPGAGAMQSFNFGQTVGALKSNLMCLNIRHKLVTPKSWQKVLWEGTPIQTNGSKNDTKATSMLAAQKWFPNTKFLKSKDGRIDAALIAMYARLTFK